MAKRRPKASINDVALPIEIPAATTPTTSTTGGLEADKPKRVAKKKQKNTYGRMILPSMSKRRLVHRFTFDYNTGVANLNNALIDIQPDHKGWNVKDADSLELLEDYGVVFDKDFTVCYVRLHVELEEVEDGLFKVTACSFTDPVAQCKRLLERFYAEHSIGTEEVELRKRLLRDACWPYVTIGEGVGRDGGWLVTQIASYLSSYAKLRLKLLREPPTGMRQWSTRDNQVLSEKYRAPEWYEAMGLDMP